MSKTQWRGFYNPGSILQEGPNGEKLSPKAALKQYLDMTERRAEFLTGGEWRTPETEGVGKPEQTDWLVSTVFRILRFLSLFLPVGKKSGRKYRDFFLRKSLGIVFAPWIWSVYFVRTKLLRQNFELPQTEWQAEDTQLIDEVKQETGSKALEMVGIPTPTGFKFFSGVPLLRGFFIRMTARAINTITQNNPGKRIVFSLETPAETALVSLTGRFFGKKAAQKMARRMADTAERMLALCDEETWVIFHICRGDLNNKPFVRRWFQSLKWEVILINAFLGLFVWKERGGKHRFLGVHHPFCDGSNDPSLDEEDYDELDELDEFPPGACYMVGILKATADEAATLAAARIIAKKLERTGADLYPAPPCGDGRKPYDMVAAQYRIGVATLQRLRALA